MGFMDMFEHYHYGSRAERFVRLAYNEDPQQLIRGMLPKSHGVSYLYMRNQFKYVFNEPMGLDLLVDKPNVPYSALVELTKNLD